MDHRSDGLYNGYNERAKGEGSCVVPDQKTLYEIKEYLEKISDEALYAYNVYQIEGEGKNLFSKIEGDKNTVMGLPIGKIKEYLNKI